MTTTREQIIQVTGQLLEKQGYNATGLNEIVGQSGAPKGSLYHYFPEGKEQIAAEAVLLSGELVSGRVRAYLARHADPAEAVLRLAEVIAGAVEQSGFAGGGPLQTVALETAASSPRLNQACRTAYGWLQAAFQEKLEAGGLPAPEAAQLAVFVTASLEGAILLSRTLHSGEPLRLAGQYLSRLLGDALAALQNEGRESSA
jgi:TetR/AcrR family transcriptional regulator, lmrAB and yxaGH operons repressor